MTKKLSIVIPVYNEESTIAELISTVLDASSLLPQKINDFEIIIVEDGSTDNTKKILNQNFLGRKNISIFFQSHNQGKGAAITRGFKESSGDIILIQDADKEYSPYEYSNLLSPILDGRADVVYGSRFKGEVTRVLYFWHYMGNLFLTMLSNMFTNLNLSDMETCYKVFKGPIIKNMELVSKRFGIEPEMTAKIAKLPEIRIYEVPISYDGRTYAAGKKIGWKDGFSALFCILKFNLFCSPENSYRTPIGQITKAIQND